MPAEFDVAVLGAGITGTAAALAAAQAGARVCVITGAPGASALFSGAWRGPCPPAFADALANAGYRLHECDDALPHPGGALFPCDRTSITHRNAQVHKDGLVCGIAGLPAFDAVTLAALWGAAANAVLGGVTLTIAGTPRAGWAPASLATVVERDPTEFASALRAAVRQHGARRVIVPAVLGLTEFEGVHARIQEAVGCDVAEALGTPPSIPGWRLHNALARALDRAGVQLIAGRARLTAQNGATVGTLTIESEVIEARRYVLATGKFISGGIVANETLHEPALQCPVWIEHVGQTFTTPEPLMLTDPERTEPQPLLRAGVHANSEQQPVNEADDVVYTNVLVAGSVRADWDLTTHGAGDCAQDGWQAGEKAAAR